MTITLVLDKEIDLDFSGIDLDFKRLDWSKTMIPHKANRFYLQAIGGKIFNRIISGAKNGQRRFVFEKTSEGGWRLPDSI